MGSDIATTALIDEAMKKSALVWLTWSDPPRTQAFWHAWLNGHAYLLTGSGEQPDPRLREGERVEVVVRSKDNAQRLIVYSASASRLDPHDGDWPQASSSLASARLNLADAEHAPERWAIDDTTAIYRLSPDGHVLQGPGAYLDESGRAVPVQTPATTGRQAAACPPQTRHQRSSAVMKGRAPRSSPLQ